MNTWIGKLRSVISVICDHRFRRRGQQNAVASADCSCKAVIKERLRIGKIRPRADGGVLRELRQLCIGYRSLARKSREMAAFQNSDSHSRPRLCENVRGVEAHRDSLWPLSFSTHTLYGFQRESALSHSLDPKPPLRLTQSQRSFRGVKGRTLHRTD